MLNQRSKASEIRIGVHYLFEILRTFVGNFKGTFFKLHQLEKMADRWTSKNDVHVFEIDLADQAAAGGESLNLKHA